MVCESIFINQSKGRKERDVFFFTCGKPPTDLEAV